MLDFHPLQLEDFPRLRPFFGYSGKPYLRHHPWHRLYLAGYVQDRVGYL